MSKANLRLCAGCEWIYKGIKLSCPKCGFVSYSAHWVYGNKCYNYLITQIPWKHRKERDYYNEIKSEIKKNKEDLKSNYKVLVKREFPENE